MNRQGESSTFWGGGGGRKIVFWKGEKQLVKIMQPIIQNGNIQ
jgi:hypothetical protein